MFTVNGRFLIMTFMLAVGLMLIGVSYSVSAHPSDSADKLDTLLIGVVSLDTVLAENAPDVVAKVAAGSQGQSNFHAVLLHDIYTDTHSTIYEITNGQIVSRTISKVDVGDADALATFVNEARSEHDADREVLTLIGHGVIPLPDIAWDGSINDELTLPYQPYPWEQNGSGLVPLKLILFPMTGQNYDFLSTPEVGDFLDAATDNGNDPFDILFFDQCFQGSLDALYEVRESAEIFIASPNYAWASYSYDQFVPTIANGQDNEAIADGILKNYEDTLDDEHPNSIFWIKSADIDALATSVSKLGETLIDALNSRSIFPANIMNLQAQLRYVDSDLNTDLDAPDEYVTLHSLATALNSLGDSTITGQADEILLNLEKIGRRHRAGHPHINPNMRWAFNQNDTITVMAPLALDSPAESIWRSHIYADPTIQLSVAHEEIEVTGMVARSLAFAEDGLWDDFINRWYPDQTDIVINPHLIAPPNIVSESLFDFEDNTQWSYHFSNIGSADIIDQTMRISYDQMQENEYVAFRTRAFTTRNWDAYDALSVAIEGGNSGNEIQIYFEDFGHGRYTHTVIDDFSGWQTISIPLAATRWENVREIGVQVRTENAHANTGVIRIDDVQLVDSTTDTHTLFDFDNATHAWDYHYSSIGQTKIVEGIMQIAYRNLSPYQYFGHHSGPIAFPEWGEYNTVSFSIKGNNSGNEIMLYLNSDTTGWADYIFIDNFNEWRDVTIPLDAFNSQGGRPTDIYRLGFQIQNPSDNSSTGVIQIDNIMLNK